MPYFNTSVVFVVIVSCSYYVILFLTDM